MTPPAPKPRETRFLLVLFAVALAVRLVFLWSAAGTPLFHAPMVDESWHSLWASELLDSGWAYDRVFFRAPLYPYFLALLYGVSDRSIVFARTVQMVISAFSVVLFYLLARRLFSRGVARTAAFALCFYGTLIWYEQALLIPVLIILLDLSLLYLLYRYKEDGRPLWLAAAGVTAGLSLVARPNLAVFLVAVGIWLVWRRRRETGWLRAAAPALVFWALALAPVIPVAWHNYAHSGDFIPIASQGGINFYLGNNPAADGLTMRMPEVQLDLSLSWDKFVPTTDSIAEALAGRQLSPGEVSSFWTERFTSYVRAHPLDFARGLLKKTYFFFAGAENSDNFDLYFYRRLSPVYALLVWRYGIHVPFGLVSPLAILGGFWLWRRRRELDLLYLFVFTYAPTVIGVLVTARHRLPVVPVFVLFAVWAAFELWRRLRSGPVRQKLFAGGALLVLTVFLNTELFGLAMVNAPQSHTNLALAHRKLGELEAMDRELEAALAADSNSVVALNNRATRYLEEGDLYMAGKLLERAVAVKPRDGDIRLNLAVVRERQGRFREAGDICWDLIRLAPMRPEPYYTLGRIVAAQQHYDSALAFYDSALVRRPDYVEVLNSTALVYLALGEQGLARTYWARAYRLEPDYPTAALNLVRSRLEAGELDSARADLELARPPWRGSADWYYYSARVALAAGDSTRGREDIAAALKADSTHPAVRSLARQLGVR